MTIAAPASAIHPAPSETTFSDGKVAVCAGGVLAVSIALAWCIHVIQVRQQPAEKAVLTTAVFLCAVAAAALGAYFLRVRGLARPGTAGLAFLSVCTALLLAVYFYWVSGYVFFPADILIWSEGDFVNDILKFSAGHPIYSPQVNNDSFTYVPGAQLLTGLLAWLAGKAGSVPAYRVIQMVYTACAAFLATLCCRRILRMAWPESRYGDGWLWNTFTYSALLLIATNSITNRFTHNLHGDALAQLATLAAYYLLLVYADTRRRAVLAAMALVSPLGFLVKQSLLMWAGWYGAFLLLWGRSFKRCAAFIAAVVVLGGVMFAICYALWGEPFFYWTCYVLGKHGVSPLRSFQHMLDAWAYFAAGLLGGAAILQGRNVRVLLGAWLVWLGIIATETYTSGIAWMLNHIGPGSLIAGVWFLAGLAAVWNRATEGWIRTAALSGAIALAFSGLGLVRIPMRPLGDDAYRYVRDIESAFHGLPASQVLLDMGTWVYVKDRVVMGDRAPSIGERGYSRTGDFSGILARIAAKRYSRILVRGFHDPDFVYDYSTWDKPSGIRQALLANYRETGRIPAAKASLVARNSAEDPYYFGDITILEPQ